MRRLIVLAFLATVSAALGHAQDLERLRFVVPPISMAGSGPYAFTELLSGGRAVVDWDYDDDPDLIVGFRSFALTSPFAPPPPNGLFLLENQGLRFVERQLGPGGRGALVVADLNGDGLRDILHGSGEPAVLLLGEPGGTLVAAVAPSLGQKHDDLDTADVDGDGDLDLLFTGLYDDLLALNDGSGSFTNASSALPNATSCHAAAFIDQEGDGDVDIHRRRAYPPRTNESDFWLNDGKGTFVQGDVLSFPSASPNRGGFRKAVDVDRDGDLDLDYSELYLENQGGGAFALRDKPGLGVERWVLDFDGDGVLDVVSNGRYGALLNLYNPGLFLFRGTGAGFVPFSDAALESIPLSVDELEARDWDGDGDDDVLIPIPHAYHRSEGTFGLLPDPLLWSHGLEGFEHPDPFPEGRPYQQVRLADVDVDGDLDLLSGFPLDWLENDGTGTEWTDRSILLQGILMYPFEFGVSDLEADGDPDLVVARQLGATLSLLLLRNDGNGTWTDASSGLPTFPKKDFQDLLVADLSGDGLDDILFLQGGSPHRFLRNGGSGTFEDATANTTLPTSALHAEAGDIDQDGDLDVVFATTEQSINHELAAYANDGSGALSSVGSELRVLGVPPTLDYALKDLDANGSVELVVSHFVVDVHAIDGTNGIHGTPLATFYTTPARSPKDLLLVDLTGDGLPEVHNTDGGLWRNLGGLTFQDISDELPLVGEGTLGATATAGDLDLDGDVDLLRGGELQFAWNVERQLAWRFWPRVGEQLVLDVYGSPGARFGLWVSLSGASPLSNVAGAFRLDPTDLVFVGIGMLDGAGRGARTIPVPDFLSFVGEAFAFQALIGFPYRWSNVEPVVLAPR